MLNKKKLEMRRIEPLWSLSGIHAQIFFYIFNVIVKISSRLTLQISRLQFFFTGQTDDRRTEPIA